jgi:hypothetical protein
MAEITDSDAFLLCSDGFWERTKVDEMAELLYSPRTKAVSLVPQAVERAVKRNGPGGDNVTLLVAFPVTEGGGASKPHKINILIPVLVGFLFLGPFLFWIGRNEWINLNTRTTSQSTGAAPYPSLPGSNSDTSTQPGANPPGESPVPMKSPSPDKTQKYL